MAIQSFHDGNYTVLKLPCNFATLLFVNSDEFRINTTVVGVFNIAVTIPTVLLNILVLMAMFRKASLRKFSYKILASLSSSNLLSGLLVQPTIGSILLIANTNNPLDVPCGLLIFTSCMGYVLACVSLLTVSFVSFERYLAIFHPFVYNRRISSRFMFCICFVIWTLSFGIILSMYFTEQHVAFFWINTFVITSSYLWNVFVYIKIIRKVQSIQSEMKKQRERFGSATNDIHQSKGMRLAAAVILILLTCYLPQIILSIWRSMPGYPMFVDGYLEYWSMSIGLFASCLNPFIYCYYNTEIKTEVMLILCYFKNPTSKDPNNYVINESRTVTTRTSLRLKSLPTLGNSTGTSAPSLHEGPDVIERPH